MQDSGLGLAFQQTQPLKQSADSVCYACCIPQCTACVPVLVQLAQIGVQFGVPAAQSPVPSDRACTLPEACVLVGAKGVQYKVQTASGACCACKSVGANLSRGACVKFSEPCQAMVYTKATCVTHTVIRQTVSRRVFACVLAPTGYPTAQLLFCVAVAEHSAACTHVSLIKHGDHQCHIASYTGP